MDNKLRKAFNIAGTGIGLFFMGFTSPLYAQDSSALRPLTVTTMDKYWLQVKEDSANKMLELKTMVPGIVYDLRYSTNANFMNRSMYPEGTVVTFLRNPAAKAIRQVEEELNRAGLGLKIFDAYRPYSVTVLFWELVHDERYVANPSKGSGHNRGIAIDLTIINKITGRELEMGTGFDNFSDTAGAYFQHLPATTLENRTLLRSLMEKNGFKVLPTEWWHFYFNDGKKYEILDLPFKKLKDGER